MNKTLYDIMRILYENNSISPVKAMTVKDVIDTGEIHFTFSAVYKMFLKLNKIGYIDIGLRDGKENTYYITQQGIQMKNELEGVA